MDEEPGLARLCIVDALAAGEQVLERRSRVLEELTEIVHQGRFVTAATNDPPRVAAEGVVWGVLAVLHARLLDGGGSSFLSLLRSLMSMIVLPYLGPRAASRELSRPGPAVPRPRRRRAASGDVLDGLNMRLTYRTVRVLMVIRERPRTSNREIAAVAGVVDPGQMSKLLNRLARLELIQNVGGGQEHGAANAWRLTPHGARVERATRPR